MDATIIRSLAGVVIGWIAALVTIVRRKEAQACVRTVTPRSPEE